jgi:hypothetical protein
MKYTPPGPGNQKGGRTAGKFVVQEERRIVPVNTTFCPSQFHYLQASLLRAAVPAELVTRLTDNPESP